MSSNPEEMVMMRMIVTLLRTAILYLFVMIGLRVMGKRQIGDMQPNELVITILISEIASIPIQDVNQPVVNCAVAIFLLVILEVLLSVLSMKCGTARSLLNGRPALIVIDGRVDQRAMKRMRLTVDDLLESLRQQNIFSLDEVAYAIVETNGRLSVLLKPGKRPATAEQLNAPQADDGLPVPVICDGKLQTKFMQATGLKRPQVEQALKERRLSADEVFLMTIDRNGKAVVVKRDPSL